MSGKYIYLVKIETVDVGETYAFRTESVAERYAARVNREAEEQDDFDTHASVWKTLVRTAREMPR